MADREVQLSKQWPLFWGINAVGVIVRRRKRCKGSSKILESWRWKGIRNGDRPRPKQIGFFGVEESCRRLFLICRGHRDTLGIYWKKPSAKCSYPSHIGKCKTDRAVDFNVSRQIFYMFQVLVPVGSGKIYSEFPLFCESLSYNISCVLTSFLLIVCFFPFKEFVNYAEQVILDWLKHESTEASMKEMVHTCNYYIIIYV